MIDEKLREAEIIIEEIKANATLRIELFKLDAIHYVAKLSANLITNIFTLTCTILALLFGTVTLGFFFSDLFNSYTLGFGGLMLFYVLVAVVVAKSKWIEPFLINFTIRKFLSTKGNGEENESAD